MKRWQDLRQRAASVFRSVLQNEKQRSNLLLCMGLAGMLLLALSAWLPAENSEETPVPPQTGDTAEYANRLESRLEEMIGRMEGAGQAQVMVTLQAGEENVYATDRSVSASGEDSTSHVLVGGNALLETVTTPRVLGVAVICEGGGDAAVQNRVSMLVETVTGVGASHITVAKMAPSE